MINKILIIGFFIIFTNFSFARSIGIGGSLAGSLKGLSIRYLGDDDTRAFDMTISGDFENNTDQEYGRFVIALDTLAITQGSQIPLNFGIGLRLGNEKNKHFAARFLFGPTIRPNVFNNQLEIFATFAPTIYVLDQSQTEFQTSVGFRFYFGDY